MISIFHLLLNQEKIIKYGLISKVYRNRYYHMVIIYKPLFPAQKTLIQTATVIKNYSHNDLRFGSHRPPVVGGLQRVFAFWTMEK